MSMRETCISQLVKVTLTNQNINTEWFNGTLFVSPISQLQAETVTSRLQELNIGCIQMNRMGSTPEFAFDIC